MQEPQAITQTRFNFGQTTIRRSHGIKHFFHRDPQLKPRVEHNPQAIATPPPSRPSSRSSTFSSPHNRNPVAIEPSRLINAFAADVTSGGCEEDDYDLNPSLGEYDHANFLGNIDGLLRTELQDVERPISFTQSQSTTHSPHLRAVHATEHSADVSHASRLLQDRNPVDLGGIHRDLCLDIPLSIPDCSRRLWNVNQDIGLQRNKSCEAEVVHPLAVVCDVAAPRPQIPRSKTTAPDFSRPQSKPSRGRENRADFQVVGVEYYVNDPSSSTGVRLLPGRPRRTTKASRSSTPARKLQ
ncbi:hypothetical protein QCA50_004293 [Cerrena zonata]|uniref:Uncharacterized protein n=1 Tax=Cerrena zonata TaxID=2478898 RepID=A0AAW0GNJ6_9APHY